MQTQLARVSRWRRLMTLPRLVAVGVAFHGFLLLDSQLFIQLVGHGFIRDEITINFTILIALTMLYVSTLLWRRKQTAWAFTLFLYTFLLGLNVAQLLGIHAVAHNLHLNILVRSLLLPEAIIACLWISRDEFKVKSDVTGFAQSLRVALAILLVALVYGVIGFELLDVRDFHHEISIWEALHRTIDQFDLTTSSSLVAYSRRAHLFLDSLSVISIGAVAYALISLFQPLKARYADKPHERREFEVLLHKQAKSSEDFFKQWPADKLYFWSPSRTAAIAYKVKRGVAMSANDPVAATTSASKLIDGFEELCFMNDWLPAYIHTDPAWSGAFKRHGYSLQKIGEEAVVEVGHFQKNVRSNKYFRHINNKFTKQGFTTELLQPPHSVALIQRLKHISDRWLTLPGRSERGFLMGYFDEHYLQQCSILVARDAASTIQAFLNILPLTETKDISYDLLRNSPDSMGNVNDYLLLALFDIAENQGYKEINLGLCPLAGLEEAEGDNAIINNTLQFVYANGDRFYSFSGLHRFKAKYEPRWENRFIAYKGGLRGFTRTLTALNNAMKVR